MERELMFTRVTDALFITSSDLSVVTLFLKLHIGFHVLRFNKKVNRY